MKIPFSFLNTGEEWHAFVIGWAETACPWWARYRCTKAAEYTPEREYHYYVFGRVIGMATLFLTFFVTATVIWALARTF